MTNEDTGKDRGDKGLLPRVVAAALILFALTAPVSSINNAALAVDPQAPKADAQIVRLAHLSVNDDSQIIGRGQTAEERNDAIPLVKGSAGKMGKFYMSAGSAAVQDEALTCLTQAIYYEAATEPADGMRAVAQVVLNRVRHPAYPSSVCGVVYEGWNQPVCQFSFVCDGSLRRAPMASFWKRSREIARAALAGHVEASVGTATHYHADYVLPRWAYTLGKVQKIGRHLFYRFPGRGGDAKSFSQPWSGREYIPRIDPAKFDAIADVEELALDGEVIPAAVQKVDPTDRRAQNDVGGRLDPDKGWRLTIPDPSSASSGYYSTLQNQGAAVGDATVGNAGAETL